MKNLMGYLYLSYDNSILSHKRNGSCDSPNKPKIKLKSLMISEQKSPENEEI